MYLAHTDRRKSATALRRGAQGISRERTMVFEYWLAAIAIGEMLLLYTMARPQRS
jgi:hypothetical protein